MLKKFKKYCLYETFLVKYEINNEKYLYKIIVKEKNGGNL